MAKTRSKSSQACLYLVRKPALQTPAEASWEASLKIQSRSVGTGRPCYEAAIPLAAENSVGKPAAKARLMPARERERGELPTPTLVPAGRNARQGFIVEVLW